MPVRIAGAGAAAGALLLAGIASVQAQIDSFSTTFQFEVLQHQAANSPYFLPEWPLPLDPSPPQGCNVTRAAFLGRHAAIYANDFDYESYIEPFVWKLGNASVNWAEASGPLAFLADWRAPINDSEIEMLTQSGLSQARQLGRNISAAYPSFNIPSKFWASSAERTVKTAEAFIQGYTGGNNESTSLEVVNEGEEDGADSLTPYDSCPAYSSSAGSDQSMEYLNKYTAPIIARFNSQVATVGGSLNNGTSFNFTASDIYAMHLLCGYESTIRGSSPFCSSDLFRADEWESFDYVNDIMYHYNTGYGQPISGAIGVPWVNATFDLLFNETATQDFYASFSHREVPPLVYVALGLFNNSAFSGANNPNATMPSDMINPSRLWRSSDILTYLTNIVVERLSCNLYGYPGGEYYRVLTSGTPQALIGCNDGPATSCSRDTMQSWIAGRQAMFPTFEQACATDYANVTNTLDIYTQ